MNPKLPYYMAYPMPLVFDDEWLERRDYEYMKSMYPDTAKKILPYVEEECDRCEHPCSMMYDEYPDRLQIRMMCNRIYQNVMENERSLSNMENDYDYEYEYEYEYEPEELPREYTDDLYMEDELMEGEEVRGQQQFRGPGRPPQGPDRPPQRPGRPPQGPGRPPQRPGRPPQRPGRPPQRPPQRPDNLRDLIEILLFEELQRRRNQQRRSGRRIVTVPR